MKRHNFGGGRATHGDSVSHRTHGSTGQRQDPGKVFKGKKMAGHMGDERVTTQNLEDRHDRRRPRPDPGRGRGAGRARAAGSWSATRSSAALPEGRADARRRSASDGAAAPLRTPARPKRREPSDGSQGHHPRRQDGRHDRARRRDFRPRAARRHPAAHRALAARQAPGRHAQDQDAAARSARTDQEDVQAEGHRPRPPRRQVARRSSAAAARRSARSCAATRTTCRRRCARWR